MNTYRLEKFDAKSNKWLDYGQLTRNDVKAIIKGYRKSTNPEAMIFFSNEDDFEGMYIRKGTQTFYTVEAI